MNVTLYTLRPELTLRQNKHVLRESRGKGTPQKSCHKAIYFINQILGLKTHQKLKKATSSFTEASIKFSECYQNLIDACLDK